MDPLHIPIIICKAPPEVLPAADQAFKAQTYDRLLDFRRTHGLGCYGWLTREGFPPKRRTQATETMIRDAASGLRLPMSDWELIAAALDKVQGKTYETEKKKKAAPKTARAPAVKPCGKCRRCGAKASGPKALYCPACRKIVTAEKRDAYYKRRAAEKAARA